MTLRLVEAFGYSVKREPKMRVAGLQLRQFRTFIGLH